MRPKQFETPIDSPIDISDFKSLSIMEGTKIFIDKINFLLEEVEKLKNENKQLKNNINYYEQSLCSSSRV